MRDKEAGSVEEKEISKAVIARLPRYYRYLQDLLEEGIERISSNELSKQMQVTASGLKRLRKYMMI